MDVEESVMNQEDVIIRKACVTDAAFVARTVVNALDLSEEYLDRAIMACSHKDTLYTFGHAIIATIQGKSVGCLIAYDGNIYNLQRDYTWKFFGEKEMEMIRQSNQETKAGELYLDSMYILPEYRGKSIGRQLIFYAIKNSTCPNVALLVDVFKPRLQAYYESIGFKLDNEMLFFDHKFNRMVYEESTQPILNDHNKEEYPPAHTTEHLLNQTMIRLFGCERSKNAHIERKKSKINYNLPYSPTPIQIADIERRINQLIKEDLPVIYEFYTRENLPKEVGLDKLPANASENIRIVRIGNYDICACIGRHVESTKDIGIFKITSTSYANGSFRIVFKVSPM